MTRIFIRTLDVFSDHARVVIAASVMLLLLVVLAVPSIRNVTGAAAADASRTNFFMLPPPLIGAPTNLSVLVASSGGITLTWNAPAGTVEHYEIERSENASQPYVFIGNTLAGETIFTDVNLSNVHAYLYRVRAVETGIGCA